MTHTIASSGIDRTAYRHLLVGLLVVAICGLALTGTAVAGDEPEMFYFEEDEIAVEPGEEVIVDVMISSDGRAATDAATGINFTIAYPADQMTVEGIQPGPFLELGEETAVHAEYYQNDGAGLAALHQWREPPAGGAQGIDAIASVKFVIDEETPQSTLAVVFEDEHVELTGDWPAFVMAQDLEIHVDGGGETIEPAGNGAELDQREIPDQLAINGDEEDPDGDTTPMPGFGASIAFLGIVTALLHRSRQ